jgi:hypothetical protein
MDDVWVVTGRTLSDSFRDDKGGEFSIDDMITHDTSDILSFIS